MQHFQSLITIGFNKWTFHGIDQSEIMLAGHKYSGVKLNFDDIFSNKFIMVRIFNYMRKLKFWNWSKNEYSVWLHHISLPIILFHSRHHIWHYIFEKYWLHLKWEQYCKASISFFISSFPFLLLTKLVSDIKKIKIKIKEYHKLSRCLSIYPDTQVALTTYIFVLFQFLLLHLSSLQFLNKRLKACLLILTEKWSTFFLNINRNTQDVQTGVVHLLFGGVIS